MARLSTWLKHTMGAIFACLVLCLSLVPTLDSMVCSSDTSAVELVQTTPGQQVTDPAHNHGGNGQRETGGDACIHGHCHQSVSPASPIIVRQVVAQISGANLAPAETGLPPSNLPDGPKEPPRA
ncbi:hypothetical protein [Caulobacter flavus]|jgi:hypothetical protein|uniref:hypothetical protein n=1 Tax=Caulobacter flavus TaxID=1679497 RepID=UPI0011AFC198|nr:hypothetical protein [Caulobacter flavus]